MAIPKNKINTSKRKKITDNELVSIIDSYVTSNSSDNTKVSKERAIALKYFESHPFGNEKKGRSTYVSSDVFEVISWALPQIIKVFENNDNVVKFDPVSPEGVNDAQLATEYCEYVFKKQNNGFNILHDFFFDALLLKNGVVEVYYDSTKEYTREEYENLSDIEAETLLLDENIEPIERETVEKEVKVSTIDPMTGQPIESIEVQRTHNIAIKRVKNAGLGKIKCECVPPEELIVSKNSRSLNLDDAPFVGRKVQKTISWLRSQGYDVPDDINDGESEIMSEETITRLSIDGSFTTNKNEDNTDPASRLVTVIFAYIQIDYDGDGITEWRKVVKIGNEILENAECYVQPFVSTSPMPMPHKFHGMSFSDLVADLQLLKSMVTRAMLDSWAFNINPAKAINVSALQDPNDLLSSNPGQWIKIRGEVNNAIFALPSTGVGAEAFQLLDYIDNTAESRVGVSRYTQGIDQNAFNKTATGTQAIMSASQEKLALITRIFAETGLGEIYKKILKYATLFIKQEQLILSGSNFVSVNPKKWMNLETLSVNVGTGSLDKAAELGQAQQIIQMQQTLMAAGVPDLVAMVDASKIYNAGATVLKSMGKKNISDFFNDPKSPEYQANLQRIQQSQQPPPPDPLVVTAQIQAQTAQQKAQQDAMLKSAEFELDVQKTSREQELQRIELELKYQVEMEKLRLKNEEQKFSALEKGIAQLSTTEDGEEKLITQTDLNAIHKAGFDNQNMINSAILQSLSDVSNGVHSITKHLSAPKEIIYDEKGNPIGARTIQTDN